MKVFRSLLLFCSAAAVCSFINSESSDSNTINAQLLLLNNNFPHEKVYLHFDKPYYTEGDTIWFKSYYQISSEDYYGMPSSLLYVDFVSPDNTIIETRRLKIEDLGAAGEFSVPSGLSGNFQIRAYTNSMRNHGQKFFFKKEIKVLGFGRKSKTDLPSKKDPYNMQTNGNRLLDFDLQFFPEGGSLVNGLSSYLGFKAVDRSGLGISVEGEIFDGTGKSVSSFKSLHKGIGGVTFRPETNNSYYAMVRSPGFKETRFELPVALNEGITLKVVRTKKHLLISGQASSNLSNKGALIVGQSRGKIVFSFEAKDDNPTFYGRIPIEAAPEGILQITLFDPNLVPRCERLVFVRNPNTSPLLKVESDKLNYDTREKVELDFDLSFNEQPMQGEVSVSITDEAFVRPMDDSNGDIYTYFLLTSDLKGHIENPNYYFEDHDPQRMKALDHLMLTQGWRRFEWKDLMDDELPYKKYLPESGITVSGTLRKMDLGKAVEGLVSVVTSDPFSFTELDTDSLGRFRFYGWESYDSAIFTLQGAMRKKRKNGKAEKLNKYVSINVDRSTIPDVERGIFFNDFSDQDKTEEDSIFDAFIQQSVKIQNIERSYDPNKIYLLEGVSVSATVMGISQDPFTMIGKIYGEPDNRIVLDSLTAVSSFPTVMDIIRGRVPGVDVRGDFPNYSIRIRGISSINAGNEPLFVVDGVPTTMEVALVISPADVYLIDVLKNQGAAMYGSRAANGVIAIYTRRGLGLATSSETPGITYVKVAGFSRPRVFYTPKYDVEKPEHVKPDYRTTLYWIPTVELNEQGKAKVSFYTSDSKSQYRIEVQGMTSEGSPITARQILSTR